MARSFSQIIGLVLPTTGLTFGGIIYASMLFRHPHGVAIAVGLGILCGLVFGVAAGIFGRSVEHALRVDSVGVVRRQIHMVLARMGYEEENAFQMVVTYRPTLRAGLFADRIRVETMSGYAKIEGPQRHVERLVAELGF